LKLSDFNPKNGSSSKKYLDDFVSRLQKAETKKGIKNGDEEEEPLLTVSEIERIMAKLRLSRAKERYGPGPGGIFGYEDVDDEITDFEIDYYSGKLKVKDKKKMSPEQRYQFVKARGYAEGHEKGCNNSGLGCVPTCRFYPEYGVITDEEILANGEERKRKRDATTRDWKRAERARITNRVFTYDPDTPNDGTNSNPNIDKIIQKLIQDEIRNRRTQQQPMKRNT
jgi:hypothetical protein